jgi:uncharacterized protein (TIGR02145 family)
VFSFYTDTIQIPDVVLISPANSATVSSLPVALSWNNFGTNYVYSLYLDTNDGSTLVSNSLTTPSYLATNLTDITTYYWKVRATNTLNNRFEESSVFSFYTDTIQIPDVVLISPTNNEKISNLPITLSWNDFGTDYVYSLYLDTNDGSTLVTSSLTEPSYLANDLVDLTTYYWKVRATNTLNGRFEESSVFSFNTDTTQIPDVELISPANSATVSGLPLTLSWNNFGINYVYSLYLDTNDGSTLISNSLTIPSYLATNLADLTTYYWKVRATNTLNNLYEESSVYSFFTDTIQIPDVVLISPANAETLSSLPVTLSWNDFGTDYVYSLYLDTNDGSTLVSNSLTTPSYLATNLVDLTTYHWKVRATNTLNNRFEESSVFSFYTDTIQIPDVELISPANKSVITTSDVELTWTNLGVDYTYSLYFDVLDASMLIAEDLTANSYTVENLIDLITYKWKVVATNLLCNRSKSSVVFSLNTSFPEIVTDIDGNIYNTILINNIRWMKENLKTTKYADGTPIPEGTGIGNYNSESTPQYYFTYADNVANAAVYGRLYTWYTVTDSKGVCPAGWHVPSYWEMDQLKQGYSGGNLKEAGTEHWLEPNLGADNITNFTALPSGGRATYSFQNLGSFAIFWTTTDVDIYAKTFQLYYNGNDFQDGYNEKKNGYAVRCVKD